jgi:Family of unknown function (DUF5681)
MSAYGPKQTCRKTQSMSPLGVKRTCLFALQMSGSHLCCRRRPESTGGKQVTGRELTQFKPGQSGNPKGRRQGSRNKLEEFFRDLCDAWQAFGKPALMTAAWTHPVEFVRVVASLIPRELEATITPVTKRMSDAQLDAIIARGLQSGLDPAATDQDAQIIQ